MLVKGATGQYMYYDAPQGQLRNPERYGLNQRVYTKQHKGMNCVYNWWELLIQLFMGGIKINSLTPEWVAIIIKVKLLNSWYRIA